MSLHFIATTLQYNCMPIFRYIYNLCVRQLQLNVVYVINISSNSKCKSITIRAYTHYFLYSRVPVEYLIETVFV